MEVRSGEILVRALNDAGVRYLIAGGLTANAHGYERMTVDLDLVVGLERGNILAALQSPAAAGCRPTSSVTPERFADPVAGESRRREKGMPVLSLWSGANRRTPIGVFVFEPFDFGGEHGHASWFEIADGLRAPSVPYRTLLEMKRDAGREQDLIDIAAPETPDPYR